MSFKEWWESLPIVERKIIGYNTAMFVWSETVRNMATALTTPRFMMTCAEDKIIIMRTGGDASGEGGMFSLKEFEAAVDEFFNKNF